MKFLFETIEDKEEFIEDNVSYDDEDESEIYECPLCHSTFKKFEHAVKCCKCAKEEVYGDEYDRY